MVGDRMMMLQPAEHAVDQRYAARPAPYNLELEQAVLGALMVDDRALDRVADFLGPHHFFDPLHGRVYETISAMILAGKPATPFSLKGFFENTAPVDDEMTVPQYLGRLAARATSTAKIRSYAREIYDYAARRALVVIGEDIAASAYDLAPGIDPNTLIEDAEQRLYQVAEHHSDQSKSVSWQEASSNALEMASKAYERGGGLAGLSTGFIDLDHKLGGLAPTDLIIIAGRPAMGKTALATNIAWQIAKSGTPVGFFSLEMSSEQLATRILSDQASIPSEKIRRGMIDEDEFKRLFQAQQEFSAAPLTIDARGGLKLPQLVASARRMKRQAGLGLLIVDYLQLVGGRQTSNGNRVQEVTEITVGLKALAKELEVPIIALSQLSRKVEERADKHPQLSDLRESGSIEQDADVVMFVYREEYYVEQSKPDEGTSEYGDWMQKMQRCHGKAEVILGKQRHGPIGTVEMAFNGQFTRFGNLARDYMLPERH
jgi:replicative DNA helicase